VVPEPPTLLVTGLPVTGPPITAHPLASSAMETARERRARMRVGCRSDVGGSREMQLPSRGRETGGADEAKEATAIWFRLTEARIRHRDVLRTLWAVGYSARPGRVQLWSAAQPTGIRAGGVAADPDRRRRLCAGWKHSVDEVDASRD
jgi:hypothetical protein